MADEEFKAAVARGLSEITRYQRRSAEQDRQRRIEEAKRLLESEGIRVQPEPAPVDYNLRPKRLIRLEE